ncbi:surfeit locus protein [Lambiella insularis]|nr:surfeit locus protein [Lambiella insularis]
MAESQDVLDRLRDHAESFNSLIQLIPASIYYTKDTSDQWKRKKQTKEEKKAAKFAKLDPDNAKSVKDIMDESARKRKREEGGEVSEIEDLKTEKPMEGLEPPKWKVMKHNNEEKTNSQIVKQLADVDVARGKAEKRKAKREQKKAQNAAKAAKLQAKRVRKEKEAALAEDASVDIAMGKASGSDEDNDTAGNHLEHIDISGMIEPSDTPHQCNSTATPSPTPQSPVFDNLTAQSGASSISSVSASTLAHSEEEACKRPKLLSMPKTNPEELKARLQQRIEALRAARKADVIDGTPARSRQELMEQRRRKEEHRKAHKKEVRQKAREEELRQRDLALSRGSPLLSPAVKSPASGSNTIPSSLRAHLETSNNFSFGRIAFDNGQTMTTNLSAVIDPQKQKGPQDPQTALQAANNRTQRISALDPTKRADIEEKDTWLNAKKRAHGEKIRDDSSLLKKTLKRKEKAKQKSGKEWGARIEGVEKGKAMRQKKREENLQKRKDEKGVKGKKAKVKAKGAKKGKAKARPGFEGSFRAGKKR